MNMQLVRVLIYHNKGFWKKGLFTRDIINKEYVSNIY